MTEKHSIHGSWRGCYFYQSSNRPGGFEAVFVHCQGTGFEGNILDEGYLGEALVTGCFHYPEVQFSKIYYRSRHMVNYIGQMSEDGRELSGKWYLGSGTSGTWTAKRGEEGEDLKFDLSEWEKLQNEEEVEREKVLTQPGKQR